MGCRASAEVQEMRPEKEHVHVGIVKPQARGDTTAISE